MKKTTIVPGLQQQLEEQTTKLERINQRLQQEICDRQHTEKNLRKSEEYCYLLLDLTHIATWDWNILTDEVTWNNNHFRLLGLEPGSLKPTYQTWRDRVHPEDIDRVEQILSQALETHTEYEAQYRIVYPNSSLHWAIARGRGLYNESGQAVQMMGILLDITERKQTEEKIREQAALIDIATDAIFVRDLENHILFWSQGAEWLYGWTAKETLGRVARELFHQESASDLEIALKATIETGTWQGS
ncbi:MAG: PAS domain-containing protein [Hydrococcus sp. RM1_1_31]|nr:PAS domain-containing protein [Hydrococcus sp. RM1_1_31]